MQRQLGQARTSEPDPTTVLLFKQLHRLVLRIPPEVFEEFERDLSTGPKNVVGARTYGDITFRPDVISTANDMAIDPQVGTLHV